MSCARIFAYFLNNFEKKLKYAHIVMSIYYLKVTVEQKEDIL